ncbi:hypothetical protein Bint_2649 [Brachyspira intermedia PWS/A]|uniref:Uncharacterized protein n=1 Tax=Brachyspira intermedia (strain ATCC 51140 / PWS/A) TaxID=1045858 RepID=G0EPH8_BRAIP|nr:hypothetical protein Bint_2649 [Brachyspira intermedia PWS/A]
MLALVSAVSVFFSEQDINNKAAKEIINVVIIFFIFHPFIYFLSLIFIQSNNFYNMKKVKNYNDIKNYI